MEERSNTKKTSNADADDLQAHLDALRQAQLRTRLMWLTIGLSMVGISIGLFAIFWNNPTFWFRPNPDMKEVERVSFEKSNDPVCRDLIEAIDVTAASWRDQRLSLKDAYAQTDPEAIKTSQKHIREYLEVFRYERRRVRIIVTKDADRISDMSRYLKHITTYLSEMDRTLEMRLAALNPDAAPEKPEKPKDTRPKSIFVEGYGELKLKKHRTSDRAPDARYATAWSKVSEDYEKWRVFRQYALPCGKRTGEIPPVPEEDEPALPGGSEAWSPGDAAKKPVGDKPARIELPKEPAGEGKEAGGGAN